MNENETVNKPTDENENQSVTGTEQTIGEAWTGIPTQKENFEWEKELQTEELTEISYEGKVILSHDLLTTILLGTSLLLSLLVIVLAAILLHRGKKRPVKEEPTAVPSKTGFSSGTLHEIGARESQQDSFAISPVELLSTQGVLAVVADGMGGLADGDKVSQSAVATMMDGFFTASGTPGEILLSLTERANRRINQLLGPEGIGRSGSTLVAGLIREGRFHYVSIGDSRICLYRDGQLIQLNREHIYRNELSVQALSGVGTLQDAARHPKAAGLTSYLGMGHLRYVDIPASGITVRSGDKFVLMSDGVYNALSEEELRRALNESAAQAAEMIKTMIAKKAYRHQDNYTAVILSC